MRCKVCELPIESQTRLNEMMIRTDDLRSTALMFLGENAELDLGSEEVISHLENCCTMSLVPVTREQALNFERVDPLVELQMLYNRLRVDEEVYRGVERVTMRFLRAKQINQKLQMECLKTLISVGHQDQAMDLDEAKLALAIQKFIEMKELRSRQSEEENELPEGEETQLIDGDQPFIGEVIEPRPNDDNGNKR